MQHRHLATSAAKRFRKWTRLVQDFTNSVANGALIASFLILCFLLLLLSPILLLLYGIWTCCLSLAVWTLWLPRGKTILFVWSESPVWKPYLEEEVFPRIGNRAVMLNWSERKRWRRLSLPVLVFRHFSGSKDYNPLAVVFTPFRRARVLRFYRPFRDFKHGHDEAVRKLTSELLSSLVSR